ncbi:MAG: argininosuccinate lyase [Candidatus Omnitrophica bacterium]|nr:argininosuccinate lyase [Candidatus Omnitrophota bacterium]
MAKKLWGGRFSKGTHKLVEEFTNSIHFDQKLAKYDVIGSLAHIDVLKKARLLNSSEHSKIKSALNSILKTIENGTFKIDPAFEDIHSYIQQLVETKAGKAGLKLHTCRSRNDQVAFDVKAYTIDNLFITQKLVDDLTIALSKLASKNKNIVLPGFTHLQHAIPVGLAQYLGAYVEMLNRDHVRLYNAAKNIRLTLGAGALAGTFIPSANYNLKKYKVQLHSIESTKNSLDAVSDRDFVIESLNALATTAMHISRLAEDMILWTSKEFDFIDIDDAFCTGSSLMPQKKNPDVLELVRGYTGRIYGNLVNVLTMMKGLPLAYNRDMQLDKEPLFDSFEIIQKELAVLTELFKNVSFKKANIDAQLADESLYATDLSDHLVQNGVAFKDAHKIIGHLIQHKLKNNVEIKSMSDTELKKFHPKLTAKAVKLIIDPKHSVQSKNLLKNKVCEHARFQIQKE